MVSAPDCQNLMGNRDILESEHCWIPMPDGTRLAARIWWPAMRSSAAALLEYIPYRKRDLVRARDERNHPYFAAHGYVCLRVDMRGSGDSEGQMPDMYSEAELADTRAIIEWIASQEWSNGQVGMFGTSWGGTAALQAAVNAPAPLKAVIANCATDNRFEDDIHWMGGALLTDSFEWGATLPAILAAPPDSATVGDGWLELWKQRLQGIAFPLDNWIRHNACDKYWRHGSVAFSTEQLSCPVLCIGGWSDRYSNSVIGLVRARPDLCWGIVGPWGHHYPDLGEPGPAIGFQDKALEWWDHWLGQEPASPLNWPRLRLWRREFDVPENRLETRNGEWVEVDSHQERDTRILFLSHDCLVDRPSDESLSLEVPNDIAHGECAGDTGYFGRVGGLPLDQSKDDLRSLCFDTEPLSNNVDLIGNAEFSCYLLHNQPKAQLVCRICEVAPEGCSNLVVRQIRNLSLNDTLDASVPFSANKLTRYRIKLPATAYRFAQGSRIRLALGSSYWPLAWPPCRSSSIRVSMQRAQLRLPSFSHHKGLSKPFPKLKTLPVQPSWKYESKGQLERNRTELSNGQIDTSWRQPCITYRFDGAGVAISAKTSIHYRACPQESIKYSCAVDHMIEIGREDGTALIQSNLFATASQEGLEIECALKANWEQTCLVEKIWQHSYFEL